MEHTVLAARPGLQGEMFVKLTSHLARYLSAELLGERENG